MTAQTISQANQPTGQEDYHGHQHGPEQNYIQVSDPRNLLAGLGKDLAKYG